MNRARPASLAFVLLAACTGPRAERHGSPSRAGAQDTAAGPAPRRTTIDSLLAAGDSLYHESPENARRVWSAALVEARRRGDSSAIARALTGLGQSARLLGDFAASRTLGEQALALKRRFRLAPAELFRSYNALGLLAWNEERLRDAAGLLDSAMEFARAAGDSVAMAKALVNAGLVANDLGAFERARTSLEQGRDAAAALHDSVTLGRALDNLAALDVQLGDPSSAVEAIDASRRIARALGDSTTELNALGQLATAYDAMGQPQRSFALLDSALGMASRAGQRTEVAEDLALVADLYLDAGDYTHALGYYDRALVATDSLGRPEERGNILRSEARVHAALGNFALATARAREALRIHTDGGFAYPRLADAIVLSTLAQQRGVPGDAEPYLRLAHSIAANLDAPVAATYVAIADAEIAVARRDWERARRSLQGIAGTLPLAGSTAEAEALDLDARAFEGLGLLDSAVSAGRRAVAAVERVRGNYASGELRTTFVADRANVYTAQVLRLLRGGRAGEAFQVADAARGRALVEHLAAARRDVSASTAAAGAPDLAREQLLQRIDALVAKLAQGEARPPRQRSPTIVALTGALRDSLVAARAEYEALVARTGAGDMNRLASPRATTSAQDVSRSLVPGEALLEYLVTPERLVIFVLTERGLAVQVVPERDSDLRSRVQLARALLQRRDGDDSAARGVLTALYGLLMQPVVETGALAGIQMLTLVPHGPLSYLPFGALIDPHTGRYAVEQFAFLRVPTAASLPRLRDARQLAAHDETFSAVDVFAPFPDSLPATRDEAESVHRVSRGGHVYLAAAANKLNLREALGSSDVVHVATHARMNSRNPLFSEIELAGAAKGASPEADRLEVHELLGFRVRSRLVFLSGCETGLGASWSNGFDVGEDYTTIGQTFLFAGARDVVATLWRIDDAGAAAFATRFYAALQRAPVADALARAQRAMMADRRYRSPYYWAAYEVSGAGTPPGAHANRAEVSDQR